MLKMLWGSLRLLRRTNSLLEWLFSKNLTLLKFKRCFIKFNFVKKSEPCLKIQSRHINKQLFSKVPFFKFRTHNAFNLGLEFCQHSKDTVKTRDEISPN